MIKTARHIKLRKHCTRKELCPFEKGYVFFPSDFEEIASPEAVRQMLSRMVKPEILCASVVEFIVYHGQTKFLGLDCIPPFGRRYCPTGLARPPVKIIPTGDQALNQLGLSTQIPVNAVYITNGARKKIGLANGRQHHIQGKQRIPSV